MSEKKIAVVTGGARGIGKAIALELAKAGIPVKGISITSEELETYFLNLTGGASHA
mgnify:CR=1 FL=1